MRVCLEATSLRGLRSGIGHTTWELARSLLDADASLELVLFAMSAGRGPGFEHATSHPRIRVRGGRPWVRACQWLWWRTEWPPVEVFSGRFDVFHAPNYLLPPLLGTGVLTVHDLGFMRHPELCAAPELRFRDVLPRTARRARRIIVSSSFGVREFEAFFPDLADRVRVVPLAVRDVFFDPPRPPMSPDGPYAVFLGNLELRKGVDVLLDAFEIVRGEVPDARLVLIGAPSFGWDRIAARHTDLLSSGPVTRTGYLPDGEAAALIAGARVLVYPSRYEGFGLPPLEGMACGTPVIAANAGPLPEVLGPHARYVAPSDERALAHAMAEALTSTPDRQAIADARAHARTFTRQRTAAETLRVYREAAEAS